MWAVLVHSMNKCLHISILRGLGSDDRMSASLFVAAFVYFGKLKHVIKQMTSDTCWFLAGSTYPIAPKASVSIRDVQRFERQG